MSDKLGSKATGGASSPKGSDQATQPSPADSKKPDPVSTEPESTEIDRLPSGEDSSASSVPPSTQDPTNANVTNARAAVSLDDGSVSGRGSSPNTDLKAPSVSTFTMRDPQERETREELLNQFYATLRVMYFAGEPAPRPNAETAEIHTRIRKLLFDCPRTWRGAYEIEQLLAFVMTDNQIAAELPRRIAEAKTLQIDFVEELATQFDAARRIAQETKTEPNQRKQNQAAMRNILQRLLNDLQWFYNKRIRRREAAKRLSLRVSALFLSAFLLFFSLLFIQYFFQSKLVSSMTSQSSTETDQASKTGQ